MRRLARLIFLPILIFLCILKVDAQEKTITGKVFGDTSQPLTGVTIRVKGTNRITQTNSTGSFTIQASKGETLEITHVGYQPSFIKIEIPMLYRFR